MPKATKNKIALVLSGGGARGAYEAGILHYLRTMLPPSLRGRSFDIHGGASVGAINTCFLVATADDMNYQGREVRSLWEKVRQENIYCRNLKALFGFITKSSRGMISKFLKGDIQNTPHFPGFLDTAPFIPFITETIPWKKITPNIRKGIVKAVSIVATNVFTGRMELFIEKHPSAPYSGDHLVHFTRIEPIHAVASAAIPVIFPTVLVDGVAYTDGGLRLNTPLSPAIHLGADAILVIGLNHRAQPGEKIPTHGEIGKPAALGQVLGRVMNAVFLDKIQYDMEQLERINKLVDWMEELYGKDFLKDINALLKKKNISGDIAERGLKRLKVLRIRPSQDIGELFSQCFRRAERKNFTAFEKFLIRFLDVDPTSGVDFLSYISFIPEYIQTLLDLGFEDARSHHQQLKEFMEQ